MRDERAHLKELFIKELRSPYSFFLAGCGLGFAVLLIAAFQVPFWPWPIVAFLGGCGYAAFDAFKKRSRGQFVSPHYRMLWNSVKDRVGRFEVAYGSLKQVWDEELPVLRERVLLTSDSIYQALRRADAMAIELQKSEGHMPMSSHVTYQSAQPSSDKKVQELYRLADKNLAEYRQRLNAVLAGIQRCEAQTAVFITTLDNLRVRLLGYRLIGKTPELEHRQFLEVIQEAKAQLDDVDQALDELSFDRLVAQMELDQLGGEAGEPIAQRPFPAETPPPMPEDAKVEERPS